jgi:hypothetical protein
MIIMLVCCDGPRSNSGMMDVLGEIRPGNHTNSIAAYAEILLVILESLEEKQYITNQRLTCSYTIFN